MSWGALASGIMSAVHSRRNENRRRYEWDWEFFRGIQTRVADARAAGIHPLYALGANTYQGGSQPVDSTNYNAMARGIDGLINKKRQDELAQATIEETRSRTRLNEVRAREHSALLMGASQGARMQQNANSQQDLGYVGIENQGKKFQTPHGSKRKIGLGTSAGFLQEEYGEIAELIDGTYRYLRDRDFFDVTKAARGYQKIISLFKKRFGSTKAKVQTDSAGYKYVQDRDGVRYYLKRKRKN